MNPGLTADSPPGHDLAVGAHQRLRELFERDHARVYRVLRRLGVRTAAAAEDLAQEVFVVAAERMAHLRAGTETPFLLGVARRLAASWRRRAKLEAGVDLEEALRAVGEPPAGPEESLITRRKLCLLDVTLSQLDEDAREVFVLFELEGLSRDDVAEIVGVPPGTAASRLLRARTQFLDATRRLQARLDREERTGQ